MRCSRLGTVFIATLLSATSFAAVAPARADDFAGASQVSGGDLVVGKRVSSYPFRVNNLDNYDGSGDTCEVALRSRRSGTEIARRVFTTTSLGYAGTLQVPAGLVRSTGLGAYDLTAQCDRTAPLLGVGGTEPWPVRARWASRTQVTEVYQGRLEVRVRKFDGERYRSYVGAKVLFQRQASGRWVTKRAARTKRYGMVFLPRLGPRRDGWRVVTRQTPRVATSSASFSR